VSKCDQVGHESHVIDAARSTTRKKSVKCKAMRCLRLVVDVVRGIYANDGRGQSPYCERTRLEGGHCRISTS
jgi:hypothetical protein